MPPFPRRAACRKPSTGPWWPSTRGWRPKAASARSCTSAGRRSTRRSGSCAARGWYGWNPYADNQRSKRAVLTDDGPPFCGNKCPADAPHRGARLGEADRGGTPPAAGADPPVQRAGAPGACADRRAGSAPRNRCPCAIKYTWPLLLRPLAAGQAAVSVFAGVWAGVWIFSDFLQEPFRFGCDTKAIESKTAFDAQNSRQQGRPQGPPAKPSTQKLKGGYDL